MKMKERRKEGMNKEIKIRKRNRRIEEEGGKEE